MPKFLVFSDAEGQIDKIVAKVSALNKSHGPFAAALCTGETAAEGDGELATPEGCPIPLYFVLGKHYPSNIDETDGAKYIGHNIHFAGRSGIIIVQGIKIGCLSGSFPPAMKAEMCAEANVLLQQPSSLDVLITAQWPQDVQKGAQPPSKQLPGQAFSRVVSDIIHAAQPRYHFCGTAGLHYERAPFLNPDGSSCRVIALGRFGNAEKQKAMYAFNANPGDRSAPAQGIVATPSPFAPTVKPPSQRDSQPPPAAGFSRWNISSNRQAGGRGSNQHDQRGRHGHGHKDQFQGPNKRPRLDPDAPCWFCIGGSNFEDHLVIDIGDESYVAMAKGPINEYNALIIPVEHLPSCKLANDATWAEMVRYMDLLRAMFAKDGFVAVFQERATFTRGARHACIQVFAVKKEDSCSMENTFNNLGRMRGLKFERVTDSQDWRAHVPEDEYFIACLPDNSMLIHTVRQVTTTRSSPDSHTHTPTRKGKCPCSKQCMV